MTATELLQALRQRHIQIEVCGDKLQIHAPYGALTPELKTHLQEQKADVIAVLTASKDVQRQAEGAAKVALPTAKYTPCLLPPLPRSQCPAKVLIEQLVQGPHTSQRYRSPKLIACKQKPLANGWCEEHELAQVMLDIGAQVGYPALQLHQYRGIDDGKATWEEYVARAPRRWLMHDIEQVKSFQSNGGRI